VQFVMSTTQTTFVNAAQSYPLTELSRELVVEDLESPPGQQVSERHAVDPEPGTPFLKLIVAGYSFFCAGISDGTCE
jgi:hypothetical protein